MTPQEKLFLDELLELEEGLSDWEVNFIDDLANRLKENPQYVLSVKQFDKLRELWEKHCDD